MSIIKLEHVFFNVKQSRIEIILSNKNCISEKLKLLFLNGGFNLENCFLEVEENKVIYFSCGFNKVVAIMPIYFNILGIMDDEGHFALCPKISIHEKMLISLMKSINNKNCVILSEEREEKFIIYLCI